MKRGHKINYKSFWTHRGQLAAATSTTTIFHTWPRDDARLKIYTQPRAPQFSVARRTKTHAAADATNDLRADDLHYRDIQTPFTASSTPRCDRVGRWLGGKLQLKCVQPRRLRYDRTVFGRENAAPIFKYDAGVVRDSDEKRRR